ncbi:caspase domain-containing protein [Ephemerocybe angulata]|uniref:Caspase domain-containing protein n=1 Tax=Ephemerocybe angulata TaxID=980116 RepID=A0A8H6HT79_9AGAR|nr:caspase domain-containing protein [Tulosesus angulatus]
MPSCSLSPLDTPPNSSLHRKSDKKQIGPLFALIIGNSDYRCEGYMPLPFARNDAKAVEAFFTTSTNFKASQVITLLNATKKEMLDAFGTLETLTSDTLDPRFVIFYAGHGARAKRPEGWEAYTTDDIWIELLCPIDMGTIDTNGRVVEGIPDRVVGALLSNLARKKGNNITLILDCCHSASINRDDGQLGLSRSITNPPPITVDANPIPAPTSQRPQCTAPTRGARIPNGFGTTSAESHVLLAACSKYGKAYNDPKTEHGYFTHALLRQLLNEEVDLEQETYLSLVSDLRMPKWQVPHCMGTNRTRPLFNHRKDGHDPSYIVCRSTPKSTGEVEYRLFAGTVEGVVPSDLFHVYLSRPLQGQNQECVPFCQAIAIHIGHTSTLLKLHVIEGRSGPVSVTASQFFAKRITYDDEEVLRSISDFHGDDWTVNVGTLTVPNIATDPSEVSLSLTAEGDKVYVDRNHSLLNQYLPRRFPHTFDRNAPQDVQRAIAAWRQFNYHLDRKPYGEDMFPHIRVELHYLEPVSDDSDWYYDNVEYRCVGKSLLVQGVSVHNISVSDEQAEVPLGFTLYNDGPVDVYPYLFYFDPNSLAITPWSLVAASSRDRKVDPPLPRGSHLAVGYGTGGAEPLIFEWMEGQTRDVCFFKLFVTCVPVNLECLSQRSPFGPKPELREDKLGLEEKAKAEAAAEEALRKEYADKWGVKLITLVQDKV